MHEALPATEHAGDAATRPRRALEFRLLLTGSSVSMLGSRLSTIAYPLLVLSFTGSPVAAGWACFATTAPSVLFYLPAGALVDRRNPRYVMLTCEFMRGATVLSVVMLLAAGSRNVMLLVCLAVVEEILEVFSSLAERRIARSLVDPAEAASALAQSEARTHIVVLLGRPLGAVLFGVRRFWPFLADAATFAVSIATLLTIRSQRSGHDEIKQIRTCHARLRRGSGGSARILSRFTLSGARLGRRSFSRPWLSSSSAKPLSSTCSRLLSGLPWPHQGWVVFWGR